GGDCGSRGPEPATRRAARLADALRGAARDVHAGVGRSQRLLRRLPGGDDDAARDASDRRADAAGVGRPAGRAERGRTGDRGRPHRSGGGILQPGPGAGQRQGAPNVHGAKGAQGPRHGQAGGGGIPAGAGSAGGNRGRRVDQGRLGAHRDPGGGARDTGQGSASGGDPGPGRRWIRPPARDGLRGALHLHSERFSEGL
ncbi:MAG: Orotate phosphoribosyltransferase, partial [uncultured Chloroflexi bacterium]